MTDLVFALRLWARSPGWTAIAIVSLALGIGANALVFSLVDAVLLQPFPYRDADRLVFLWGSKSATQTPGVRLDLRQWREASRTFADADVFLGNRRYALGAGESDTVPAACIGARILPMLGVSPALGRSFTEREARPGGPAVVILSDALWRARFAEDRSIVGRTVRLGEVPYEIVGVMPPGFFFPDVDARLWVPSPCGTGMDEGEMHGLGRLHAGVSLTQAQAELDAANQRAAGDPGAGRTTGVFPVRQIVIGDFARALWMLLASVGVVLLIACANVAHLQLSRAIDRETELAIRSAAGATRARLVRQLLTESALLAIVSTAAGLVLGWAGLRLVRSLSLTDIPRLDAARLDERVLLFAIGACALTALVSGLWPAWNVSRLQADEALRLGGAATGGVRRSQLRDLLAVAEVALATLLLVTAGLVVRSFVQISRADWGFNPDRLLLVDVKLPPTIGSDPTASRAWADRVVDRLARLDGVEGASHSTGVPIRWRSWWPTSVGIDGRVTSSTAGVWVVGDGYFSVAGVPILHGREFSREDSESAPVRIVVSRAFAEQFWPGIVPIGRQVQLLELAPDMMERFVRRERVPFDSSTLRPIDGLSWEVIGVVEDVRMFGLEIDSNPAVYLVPPQMPRSMRRASGSAQFLVVRTRTHDATIAARAKAAILDVDRDVTFTEIVWMSDLVAQSIGGRGSNRLMLVVSAAFGSLALGFAAIGIFGMVSLNVTQRLRELAIRAALGAGRMEIVRTVLGHAARLLGAGLALGLTVAWAATRGMGSLLFQVTPADPATYGLAVIVLSASAGLACLIPLRRALRCDPAALLKA